MQPDAINILTLAVAALELGVAGYYFATARNHARLYLPKTYSRSMLVPFAFDSVIWNGAVPTPTRRRYLLSHIFAFLGLLSLTVLAWFYGPRFGAMLFGATTLLALADCLMCWRKYRSVSWH